MRAHTFDSIREDVAHALRSLRRAPGFTLLSVLTLALGIGAATAMYSVLHGILLRSLPVRAQQDVVVMWTRPAARNASHWPVSYADLTSFAARTRTMESAAGVIFQGAVDIAMRDGSDAVPLAATWVTGDFFSTLDVEPALGRRLAPSDDVPGAAPVMTISHSFWMARFGGSRDVIGRALSFNGKRYSIVGVLPRGFDYPKGAQAWLPVIPSFPATLDASARQPEAMVFDIVGRLRGYATVSAARQELAEFLRTTDSARSAGARGAAPVVTPFADLIVGDVRAALFIATAAVSLLLLIACINVANLLLVRGNHRTPELAIRAALGATRGRLVRALLTESSVLTALGGGIGVVIAFVVVRTLVLLAPAELPQREMIAIDARALIVALAITLCTALLAGIIPSLLAARGDLGRWLRSAHGPVSGSRSAQALRHAFVVGQVSLSILVVVCAALVGRSLYALQHADMGFDGERLVVAEALLLSSDVSGRERQVALQESMIARVAAIPGVSSATAMPKPPFSAQGGWIASYTGEGQTPDDQRTNPSVGLEVVGPGFFGTLGMSVLRGRAFDDGDREGALRVAIISEAVARATWPNSDAVGKRIKLGAPGDRAEWHTVVGVVGETRYRELAATQPSLYLPTRQFGGPVPMTLAVRVEGDADHIIPAIRKALAETHPELVMTSGGAMTQLLAAPLARPRFSSALLGAFALITLLLALVGVYGMLAALVRHRRRELGIRLALGATAEELRWFVLRLGMRLAVAGCAIGVVAALAVTRLMQSMLAETSASDPFTYGAVVLLVLSLAALSCLVPALRAGRTQPMVILRSE